MDMLPWVVAAVMTLLVVVGMMRLAAANQRAELADKRAEEALSEVAQLNQQLKAPKPAPISQPAASQSPASQPPVSQSPVSTPAPASEAPPKPAPALSPALKKRAQKMLKQAREMARFLDLDNQVTVGEFSGYRVPIELADDEAVEAYAHLRDNIADEPYLLEVGEDRKGTFFIVRS